MKLFLSRKARDTLELKIVICFIYKACYKNLQRSCAVNIVLHSPTTWPVSQRCNPEAKGWSRYLTRDKTRTGHTGTAIRHAASRVNEEIRGTDRRATEELRVVDDKDEKTKAGIRRRSRARVKTVIEARKSSDSALCGGHLSGEGKHISWTRWEEFLRWILRLAMTRFVDAHRSHKYNKYD